MPAARCRDEDEGESEDSGVLTATNSEVVLILFFPNLDSSTPFSRSSLGAAQPTNTDNTTTSAPEMVSSSSQSSAAAATSGGSAMPATGTKRKRNTTDPEIITLDSHYDLTIIVGTPKHKNGQKAFRVNKGSMRHASDVWTKMLTGEWVESKTTEIEFPDDSWKPFHMVLKIAHLQFDELPDSLPFEDLQQLATLTDKYNLAKAVRVAVDRGRWLHKYKHDCMVWPSSLETHHFATMTSIFQYDSDLLFIISKLAVEVKVDAIGKCLYHGSGAGMTGLTSSLPDHIIGESYDTLCSEMRARDADYLHANITGIRNRMLLGLIAFSKQASNRRCLQSKYKASMRKRYMCNLPNWHIGHRAHSCWPLSSPKWRRSNVSQRP